jgi:hypothetical protein
VGTPVAGILTAVRTIVVASLTGLALAVAAEPAAATVDIQTCRSHMTRSSAPGYERVGRAVRKTIVPGVRNYLGRQYTAYWLQPHDAGWYVGVAPGKRSLAQVRTYLYRQVGRHFRGPQAALIRSRMHVIAQPYGARELVRVGNAVWDILRVHGPEVNWSGNEACTYSDAYRSEVTLYEDSTQADVDEVKRLVARFGDKVRVVRVDRPMT